ncbi:MAG: TIGR03088 family PEP-CTERM/XrtA system glycosyltransferase, partial [Pseudomonadota bacterium]
MSSPRIVHVIYRFAMGGMENGLVNLINGMDRGYRHAIVCLDRSTDFAHRLTRDDVEIVSLHKKAGKDLPHYGRLFRALRKLRPAIVHTRNIGTIEAGIVARSAGVSNVLHGEHGFDVADLHGTHSRYRQLRRLASPFVRRFVCVSEQIRGWLERDVGLPTDKLVQIYNGVDTQRFAPDARESARHALKDHGVTRPFIVGAVGRLEVVKNQVELLRAYAARCARDDAFRDNAALCLLGDGSQREHLEREAAQAGCADGVHFLGARDDVPALLPGLDVFVLPSLNEGISNTLLEAMACGVPVVASRVGGNAELFLDGREGTLYESGDDEALSAALGRYFGNPDMREARSV